MDKELNKTKTISMDYNLYKKELDDSRYMGYLSAMIDCLNFVKSPYIDKGYEGFFTKTGFNRDFMDKVNTLKIDAGMKTLEEELAA